MPDIWWPMFALVLIWTVVVYVVGYLHGVLAERWARTDEQRQKQEDRAMLRFTTGNESTVED